MGGWPERLRATALGRPVQVTREERPSPSLDSACVSDSDAQTPQSEASDRLPQRPNARKRWHRRPTVQTLIRQAQNDREVLRESDERANDETRLPMSEAIHLGGLVLAEAFTPSTVSSLFNALERWPSNREARRQEWLAWLARSRGGQRGGWQTLGFVRPPGGFVMGDGHHDSELPPGVDAVWLHLSFVTPALAMVVATFTITESAGDLSGLLRRDYRTRHFDTRVRVYGPLGDLRARLPWARPARHGIGYSVSRAEDQKRRACQAMIRAHEEACSRWFFARFPGRFSAARSEDRPVTRMLFTTKQVPYAERHPWLRSVGLEFALPLWRSTERDGWWLSSDRWPHHDERHVTTLAARRADAAEPPSAGESGESNWDLTQRFGSDQAPLAARLAIPALLDIYAARLAGLRDRAGVRRLLSRPVRDARTLDDYLSRDGLDAATVTSDLELFTRDLTTFRWDVPEFTEYREHLGVATPKRTEVEYLPALRIEIREQAARLASDTTNTTGNIRASAELRQAIANTRLQRFVFGLSVCAIVVAIIGLLAAQN